MLKEQRSMNNAEEPDLNRTKRKNQLHYNYMMLNFLAKSILLDIKNNQNTMPCLS